MRLDEALKGVYGWLDAENAQYLEDCLKDDLELIILSICRISGADMKIAKKTTYEQTRYKSRSPVPEGYLQ